MMRRGRREECDDEDGKGYSNDTRVYDMHANDIRKEKKNIKEYATTKVPKATKNL
jgi:hypothetical protein